MSVAADDIWIQASDGVEWKGNREQRRKEEWDEDSPKAPENKVHAVRILTFRDGMY